MKVRLDAAPPTTKLIGTDCPVSSSIRGPIKRTGTIQLVQSVRVRWIEPKFGRPDGLISLRLRKVSPRPPAIYTTQHAQSTDSCIQVLAVTLITTTP